MRFSAAMTAERLLPGPIASRAMPLLHRVDAVLFSTDERGEAGRMSLFAFAVRIVSAAIAFVSQVLLARWMGSFEYGIFVLVWVAMVIDLRTPCVGDHQDAHKSSSHQAASDGFGACRNQRRSRSLRLPLNRVR